MLSTCAFDEADRLHSCKHLCCREGVDKAPKAPKGSSVSAASLIKPSDLPTKRNSNGSLPAAKRRSTAFRNGQDTEIEIIDLAGRRDEKAEDVPKDFGRLDKLHKSVNKRKPASLIGHRKPSFDYMNDELPQVSFLSKARTAIESSDKLSTDYGDDLMGDLPSPSAFLGKRPEEVGSLSHYQPTNYGSDFLSPSAPLRRDDEATDLSAQAFPDYNFTGDIELTQLEDDEADLEDAMVGMSDSMAMQEDSQAQAATAATTLESNEASTNEQNSRASNYQCLSHPAMNQGNSSATAFAPSKEERLFLSTDSPEKPIEQAEKRSAAVAFEDDRHVPQSTTPLNRFEISAQPNNGALQGPFTAGHQIVPPPPTIKPGLPAWVYDFDPGFIAEFQDYVDFI